MTEQRDSYKLQIIRVKNGKEKRRMGTTVSQRNRNLEVDSHIDVGVVD